MRNELARYILKRRYEYASKPAMIVTSCDVLTVGTKENAPGSLPGGKERNTGFILWATGKDHRVII